MFEQCDEYCILILQMTKLHDDADGVWTVVDGLGSSTNSLRDMEQMKPLMKMVFYCIDKMKRLKLSKEVHQHFSATSLSFADYKLST